MRRLHPERPYRILEVQSEGVSEEELGTAEQLV